MTAPDPAPDFVRATRRSYDAIAGGYARWTRDELAAKPLERGVLAVFAEHVVADGGGLPLADVGCGTGRVTGHLHKLGLGVEVFGIDLAPGMLAEARRDHPGLRFEEGSMLGLDLPDGSLGGLLAWYSTIHVPDEELPRAFAEFHRVLAPGAPVQLGFQVGDEPLRMAEAWGHEISLVFHRRQPERMAALLRAAGLEVRAVLWKERETEGPFPERAPQGFVLARRPVVSGGCEDGDTEAER
ncbi:class I SAM-dependent methyltransferase [Streptomyces sp. NPDC012389]|uniref:class I SAM-dependent methyltransferase n=1 Tax=unclassified Streptomyces TaxID=2593676 RepID=UPI00081ED518|nr:MULTISPECIES: class I SAM-dependent methyltransferase [unclassified Streptomyces]MYR98091.1 methyltransferase domain-containing protein [Streptomyces sp. SID4937]SCE33813.1 Methyltransferase domain-containing protein [Streptomyces sp. ScaeMP-e83]